LLIHGSAKKHRQHRGIVRRHQDERHRPVQKLALQVESHGVKALHGISAPCLCPLSLGADAIFTYFSANRQENGEMRLRPCAIEIAAGNDPPPLDFPGATDKRS
jgi:hypothetical protein